MNYLVVTDVTIPVDVQNILSLNHRLSVQHTRKLNEIPVFDLLTDIEYVIKMINNLVDEHEMSARCTNIITNYLYREERQNKYSETD